MSDEHKDWLGGSVRANSRWPAAIGGHSGRKHTVRIETSRRRALGTRVDAFYVFLRTSKNV